MSLRTNKKAKIKAPKRSTKFKIDQAVIPTPISVDV